MTAPKKLIEVALPLEDINAASAREKSIRHGHPSTLHLWWARRPLAAARAVLFSQLVDDPSGYVEELWEDPAMVRAFDKQLGRKVQPSQRTEAMDEVLIKLERERLFDLIRDLVKWENTNNKSVLEPAREEIRRSWRRTCRREGKPEDTPLPPFLDPFAGGGAIPLEAQRLGLEAHASDLNPVAVLINKAMIEIPPKFANLPPVHPEARKEMGTQGWKGAAGLAEDVRRYGQWMREEAFKRVGHLYPPYTLTQELIDEREDLRKAGYKTGDQLTVIAWLWARTVPSPDPALRGVSVPLISSFWLSKKKGAEAYIAPSVKDNRYNFRVCVGSPKDKGYIDAGTKVGRGGNFACLLTGGSIPVTYIRKQGKLGNLNRTPLAVVCEGKGGRIYLPPHRNVKLEDCDISEIFTPSFRINHNPRDIRAQLYGFDMYTDLFTDRQLVALNLFSQLVKMVNNQLLGLGVAKDYADAVSLYLGLAVGKCTDYWSSLCSWHSSKQLIRNTFGRQAIPITWDFAEANPFCDSSGTYSSMLNWVAKALARFPAYSIGSAKQIDAAKCDVSEGTVISTDPPYYDNIAYADLSDYFYVWLRNILKDFYPSCFSTILVPKGEELVASPYRHGSRSDAEKFFLEGMTTVLSRLSEKAGHDQVTTIYYAFKQSESSDEGIASTGWATFLEAVKKAGFSVVGTWPMRTEMSNRSIASGSNALASSIVLVCRHKPVTAPIATRREFVQALQRELPQSLRNLQHGNIAPVDLPQSSIGPGMAIFSRYSKVVEADGSRMSVRTALQLINQSVDEFLSEQEAQMDDWTRFAVTWFSHYGFKAGPYGDAQNIATARNVSVDGVRDAGIIQSGGGKVRLLQVDELEADWDPQSDTRCTVWEVTHHLIRRLNEGGEEASAALLKQVGGLAEDARSLCYRLYTICEQRKWAEEARAYNALITTWASMEKVADTLTVASSVQSEMDF